jgi:hypothetical protein
MAKKAKKCEKCGSDSVEFSRYCGADVCNDCNHHQGMARCYCGWAVSGGDGRRELVEMGETIEPEDCTNSFEADFS